MTATEATEGREYPVVEFSYYTPGEVMSHSESFDALRSHGAFVRTTGGARGYWVFTESGLIREALQHPDIFSSSVNPDLFSSASGTEVADEPPYNWIPELLDPPEHTKWRQLLAPHFAPKLMEAMEPKVRARCSEIIETFAGRGSCDFMHDFAWRYPTTIFMELMGLPLDGLEQFLAWEHDILHLSAGEDPDRSRAFGAMMAVQQYFAELIEQKRAHPGDDLLTTALSWKLDGRPISQEDMLSWCLLMFMAGLDTVSIQLAYSFWYLADHPDERGRLVADPSLIPGAVEEFLRCFAFVPPPRRVTRDTEFHGCPMKKGDAVVLPLSAANRDPAVWDRPTEVVIDREPNNHIAFGAGPHRCLGSHLARRELKVAIEEWHKRIPDYRLADAQVPEHGGMWGIDALSLVWEA
ncbi:MAG TPA: cytochrome P450 [Acidimicrobiales bacterium]|nr:cytochrome P450 [Acidimicrobiales bacterium]